MIVTRKISQYSALGRDLSVFFGVSQSFCPHTVETKVTDYFDLEQNLMFVKNKKEQVYDVGMSASEGIPELYTQMLHFIL